MSESEVIDKLVDVYRSVVRYPNVLSGRIILSNSDSIVKIQSKWAVRNLEKKEVTKFQRLHCLDSGKRRPIDFPPVDVSTEQLSSFSSSGKYLCILREVSVAKDSLLKKKQFLEVWENETLYKNFDIEEFDVHGAIYSDGEFGSLEWSPDETRILYIAEKKQPKTEPFYKQKSCKSKPDETVLRGEEHAYRADWGEQLVDKREPVIGICDIRKESIQVVEGQMYSDFQGKVVNYSLGQVLWMKNGEGFYGIALKPEPRKLGLIYCTNREGYVFKYTINGKFESLYNLSEERSVRSPRLSIDGKYLFWLQRPAKGPHHACHELVRYDLTTRKTEIMITLAMRPGNFCGLYMLELPKRCFSKDGRKLFFSTANKTRILSYVLNLDTREIRQLDIDDSSTILDVHNDMMLITTSNLRTSPALKFTTSIQKMEWIEITRPFEVVPFSVIKHMDFNLPEKDNSFTYFNAIYFGPEPVSNKKIPLIVFPHGGPHSSVTDTFSIESAFFVKAGFGILYVNYRGSTGCGQDGIDFLPGKIGDTDVKDNDYAVDHIMKELPYIDPNKIVLCGGSHGGFLVAHLSAQYPDKYKAVVNRNPVIDVLSMYSVTDIPDWNMVESGFAYDGSKPLSTEQLKKMYRVSPITIANRIRAPTFIMLGKKDLRVPHSQGLALFYILKSSGIETKVNLYDDDHTIGKVANHLDVSINAALWFMKHVHYNPFK